MAFQAFSEKNQNGRIEVTFDPPFSRPPVVIITPAVPLGVPPPDVVPTLVEVTENHAVILDSNTNDPNYRLNVLAVDASSQDIEGLPVSVGSLNKAGEMAEITIAPPPPAVCLLSSYWKGSTGTVAFSDFVYSLVPNSPDQATTMTVKGSNQASNYFTEYVATAPNVLPGAQAGITPGPGSSGPSTRIYFGRCFQSPPLVFVSASCADSPVQADGRWNLSVTRVTENAFNVLNAPASNDFTINWLAIPQRETEIKRADIFDQAFNMLCECCSEADQKQMRDQYSVIRACWLDNQPAPAGLTQLDFIHPPSADLLGARADLTECETAIAVGVINAALLVLTLAGVYTTVGRVQQNAIAVAVGGRVLDGCQAMFIAFKEASSVWGKARALVSIIQSFWNARGFRFLIKVIADQMSFWDWVRLGITMFAQLIVWVATDFLAVMGQLALAISGAINLIEAINTAVHTCGSLSVEAAEPLPA